jgi:hypothetical protein
MRIFAIQVRLFGTVYIKQPDISKAEAVLVWLCGQTINAKDRGWFSEESFEFLPLVSFATSFTPDGPVATKYTRQTKREVDLAQRSFVSGFRDTLIPNNDDFRQVTKMPLFAVDMDVITTAFVKANTVAEARKLVGLLNGTHVDLQMFFWRWFSDIGFDEDESHLPLILSTALEFVGPSQGCKLYQRWPDLTYNAGGGAATGGSQEANWS